MKLPFLNKTLSARWLAWLCAAAVLLSIAPLYALSLYNHACYDDFGFSLLTHDCWLETGSVFSTIGAAVQNTIGIRSTWEGTYATSFISALQPALFGEHLYWVTTLVLLTGFLFSVWFFLRQTLIGMLQADKTAFWLILSALAFVLVQFVPEVSEAFFWFNGGVAYTLLWSVMLGRIGVWLAFIRAEQSAAKAGWGVLLFLLTVAVGGAKYSTLLFAALVDILLVCWAFAAKRRTRWTELLAAVLLLACFLFNAMAPGNAVRAATLGADVSAPEAVVQAFYFGLALAGRWFSLPLAVVWALMAWQMSDSLRRSAFRFRYPVWVTLGCICLFCAQLTPTLYTGNYLGDGRTVNTYFYTFVLMSSGLVLYWTGWYLRKNEGASCPRTEIRLCTLAAAAAVFLLGCMGYSTEDGQTGLTNMSGVSALKSLVTGQAQAYDEAMTARDRALTDPAQPEVSLTLVENIPDAFMGDALESDNLTYVLHLYADYYDKQRVSVAQEH